MSALRSHKPLDADTGGKAVNSNYKGFLTRQAN